MPEEREITSPVKSNVKNPPWGTEAQTPDTGLQSYRPRLTFQALYSSNIQERCYGKRVQIDPSNYIDCLLIYF